MNFFEQNLAIMRLRNPELAALMESDLDCSHIEMLPTHDPAVLTARVTLLSGEKVLLHNMDDAIGSAKRSADKQEMKGENATILLGFGLGYLAIELEKKLEKKHPLIICEEDPAIVKMALTHVDLRNVVSSDFIRVLAGPEIPLEEWILKLAGKFMTAKVDVISYEPARSLHPEAYLHYQEIAQKESRAIILNRNTILKAGRMVGDNFLYNFPEVMQSAGVARLKNLLKDRPAILVAAGPSLEKNVHLLRGLEGRAVVISVDTALRLLLPLGIKPDIVTTLDFNAINFEKFKNVPMDPDITLVYHPGGYHKSIQAFHGPRFTLSQVPNRIPWWLMEYVGDKGTIFTGTTVAHMSFKLACHLGCNPIVMVGQDLAFPHNQIHASDLSLWGVGLDDVSTVEDIFGEQVATMTSFKHAIYHFEKMFKDTTATVIDATEAGAKKQGPKVMRLQDVIADYCQDAPIDVKEILRKASLGTEPVRMDELLREMQRVSEELDIIQRECKDIMTVTRKLAKKIHAGETNDEQFAKLSLLAEQKTEQMNEHGKVIHLIGEQNFALELYMSKHENAIIDEIDETDKKIARQVERAIVFYPSVLRAAGILKKPLDRLIGRLRCARQMELRPLNADSTADEWFQRAFSYKKIEYRLEALRTVEQALAKQSNHVPALKLLARLCLDLNRVQKALEVVKQLQNLKKRDREVEALAQQAETKHTVWAERCVRLQSELVTKVREDSLEEAGWFYYRVKDYPRAVAKLEQAVSEKPGAETYARLGRAKLALQDEDGAVQAWGQALALDPRRSDLYKELGILASSKGQTDQAEAFWEEAVRYESDDAVCWESLARTYLERGAYADAALCYENLLRLTPGRSELIPQIAALYQRQIAVAATSQ